jgi:hypothetical protein
VINIPSGRNKISPRYDLTGKIFGRLTVVSFAGYNKKARIWNTVCECGAESVKRGYELVSGAVVSCGCKRVEKNIYYNNVSKDGNQAFKYGGQRHYTNAKRGALQRGYTFTISLEEFKGLIVGRQCYYCTSSATGLDRINSDVGYEIDNLVPCCKVCNRMKGTLDKKRFLEIIQQIYANHFAASDER